MSLGNITKHTAAELVSPSRCVHTLSQEDHTSVLSLAASEKYLFSGSQGAHIAVWDLATFTLVKLLYGHQGSVLALSLSPDETWLFSSSGDGTVRVWDIESLQCVYLIHCCHDVGDIFSIVYSEVSNLLFLGSQNTSIQWYDFSDPQTNGPSDPAPLASISPRYTAQTSKFFGSKIDTPSTEERRNPMDVEVIQCVIRDSNVLVNAHDGYVYCLALEYDLPNIEGEVLISGSGDGDVKLWRITNDGLQHLNTLKGSSEKGILTLAVMDDGYLFCGVQGGNIQVWDLETHQMIRSIMAHSDDVLSLCVKNHDVFSASADGTIKRWDRRFECKQTLDDHEGIVLSLATSQTYLISGASDHSMKIWDIPSSYSKYDTNRRSSVDSDSPATDVLLYALEQWISLPTVSGDPKYLDECRQGARFLKSVLKQLGADSRMIPGASGRNPLVYGKFTANSHLSQKSSSTADPSAKVPTVLFYGHYDVINAEHEKENWISNPFKLTGRDGYLYARGVTDNKGPILASVFAVSDLVKEGLLDIDVIFLVEGEEESGSIGFANAALQHKELFQDIDMILLSNSYWLGEDVPCLTYGLRGVIRASLTVSTSQADLHSGVEGGAASEPLIDMIKILAKLVSDDNKVLIPGFYDDVRPVSSAEERLYDPIISWMHSQVASSDVNNALHITLNSLSLADGQKRKNCEGHTEACDPEQLKKSLMARWRYPTFTVHKIDVSLNNPTIIPRQATAAISMRIVPDQDINVICEQFKLFVENTAQSLGTDNKVTVEINNTADYWLGDCDSPYFKAAEKAIEQEWGIKPLFIREGGSIPAVRWLERFCSAPAVHLPMGQASDQAHLCNERIKLKNLYAGRRIVKSLLRQIGPSTKKL
ncbi:unnamed protein product [Umbelopsis ramanniana]